MDIKQLRVLLAVAETGSATRAADLLRIVQPAVSRHVRLLEEELGVELFERERHGMVLTEAGRTLVEYGRRALQELDRAKAEITPTTGVLTGTVAIGLLPSTCELLAAELVATVKSKHPQIVVRLNVGYAGNVLQWLEAGDIEIALLYGTKASSTLHVEALLDEQLYLIGPPGSLEPGSEQSVDNMRDLQFVLPNAPHGLRSVVDHAWAVAGISPTVGVETNSLSVQKALVSKGFGHTVLPSSAVSEEMEKGTLSGAPIISPNLSRRIVLAQAAGRRLSPASSAVATELVALIRRLVLDGAWPGASWVGT
ncbi:transcriptional regulator LysR family (plasmid) [Cupriavidus necator N-1]|uniref:Transcriptional regulator LysR family n=1 Tax=Cupriavidus necator (strain ATCC 43291 / DSM 13513 / CCUG 52238 / LMG 8453 / N-1) TaxID=1042878 RepID=F8GUJ4_CUPNN|nr:LysR family transcriptional regulator [Cupriavidus necator]AEI82398.1 transcriptional regulator LysR family [Cupriavidus necator N-1]MDX6007408.1 LysR family transcriptional regulator [Cupriavidus necator]